VTNAAVGLLSHCHFRGSCDSETQENAAKSASKRGSWRTDARSGSYNLIQGILSWEQPSSILPSPPQSDKIAYGGYIVNSLAGCFECHSTPGPDGTPDIAHHLGAGGFEIELAPGMVVRTPNITPDQETGIGALNDPDIKTAITEGLSPEGGHLSPPMPYPFYKGMTPDDLDAVVAYLRTIPAIKNKVERTDFQKKSFPIWSGAK
jgi:hypothetical protein